MHLGCCGEEVGVVWAEREDAAQESDSAGREEERGMFLERERERGERVPGWCCGEEGGEEKEGDKVEEGKHC
jgi:hypothetical protein